jgi:hypothetical protein
MGGQDSSKPKQRRSVSLCFDSNESWNRELGRVYGRGCYVPDRTSDVMSIRPTLVA